MLIQTGRRLVQGAVVLLLVTFFTFFLVNLAPGGPASVMRMGSTAEEREALIEQLGLNRPLIVQYGDWLGKLARGDFGTSLDSREPITPLIGERLINTLRLGAAAFLLLVVIGTIAGIVAALAQGTWLDLFINFITTVGMSVPEFWLGLMAIFLFSVELGWLPASSSEGVGSTTFFGSARYLVMPVCVLAFVMIPNVTRYARSAMLEALASDYIRTAKGKGLGVVAVVGKHAFRNALISVTSMLGLLLPVLLSGAVVIESVFGWPGIGRLAVEAAMHRNYPLIMAVTVVSGALVICTNIVVDLLYGLIDPRLSYA